MAAAPCKECGRRPKITGRHRCVVCQLRHEPIGQRAAASARRLAMVPEPMRRKTVPARLWPEGTRWCAGCQSFVDLEDCGKNGTRCKPCAWLSTHGAMVQKTYGISQAEYDRLLELQGGKCAVCRARPKSKALAVDHDHKTGAVRGLLCSRCNHDLMGSAWDSMATALALWHYMNTPPMTGNWVAPERGLPEPPSASTPVEPVTPSLFAIPSERGSGAPKKPDAVAEVGRPSKYTDPVRYPALSAALARVKADAGPAWAEEPGRWILYKDVDGYPTSPPPF